MAEVKGRVEQKRRGEKRRAERREGKNGRAAVRMDGLWRNIPWELDHRLPWRASDEVGLGRTQAQPVEE